MTGGVSDLTCDVLVVGGGMAGVSIGAALAAQLRVTLVEAEPALAVHATGRSAAVYLPSYGGRVVRSLTVASRALYDQISEERGEPLLRPRSLLWLAVDAGSEVAVRAVAADSGTVEWLDPPAALRLCSALRPERVLGAGLDAGAMEIDVAALHQTYLARLRRLGGTVLAGAPLRAVTRQRAGWRVVAGEDTIDAGIVVDAAGAWADEVAARAGIAGIGLRPMRRTAFVSPVPGAFADQAGWPLVNDGLERWYFKPEAGGRVLVSPADETPSEPCDARPEELEIARAIEAINEVTTLQLRSVSHAWAGLRSFVADRAPVVGARAGDDGWYFFAGQGGYGIQMAPALAELGASLLLTGTVPPRLAAAGLDAAAVSPDRLVPA
jgi:D-arginine dehydrogenase